MVALSQGQPTRWVTLHPQHTIVRGFLVVNDRIFNKHSVIDTGRPKLLDVTPRPPNESRQWLNFIEYDGGGRDLFDEMPAQVLWP